MKQWIRVGCVALLAWLCACCDTETKPTDAPVTSPGDTVYVDIAAQEGGTGSQEHPLRSLAEAMQTQIPTIVVAQGAYELPATWEGGHSLSIKGAGPQNTFLLSAEGTAWRSTDGLGFADMSFLGPMAITGDGSMTQVTFNGATAGLHWSSAQSVDLTDLNVIKGQGLTLEGIAEVEITALMLEENRVGLSATSIESLSIEEASLRSNIEVAMSLTDSTTTLREVEIADTVAAAQDGGNPGGDGVRVQGGALTWDGGGVQRSADRGIAINNATATLQGLNLRVSQRPLLAVSEGAVVEGEDLSVADGQACLFANQASLTLHQTEVQNCNLGMLAGEGATVSVTESSFVRCAGGHISLTGADIKGTFTNTRMDGSAETCFSAAGTALTVEIKDSTLENCVGQAIGALGVPDLVVTGTTIRHVTPDPVFMVADGIGLVDSAGRLERNIITETEGKGVGLLRSSGQLIENTIMQTGDGGISMVDPGAEASLIKDNTISNVRAVGVLVFGAEAVIEENLITDIELNPEEGLGDGVLFGTGAQVTVLNNTIMDVDANGVLIVDGARGEVRGNTISGSGQYGVREYCQEEGSQVMVMDNVLTDNARGEMQLCQ